MRFLRCTLVVFLFLAASAAVTPSRVVSAAQSPQKKEVTVWVNTRSGVYHCPGTRW